MKGIGLPEHHARRTPRKILLIEDDDAIVEVLVYNLERDGYKVQVAADGRQGLVEAQHGLPDLILLDLMLPGIDGIEVCRELRAEKATRAIPILMLTAKSEEADQLIGFSVGADDYVTKPFSVRVLLQRIRVLLERRFRSAESGDLLSRHGIELDRIAHQASIEGKPLPLTRTEFRLLETMISQPGRAFSRGDLLNSAIGEETIVLERTIDVHIRSLRQKLGDHAAAIETVRGVGYRFARDVVGG